jgi:class 3 adenylate cyclase
LPPQPRGDDISGLAVNIAARITHLAAPGEILVSSTVVNLVTGSTIAFTDRGKHELKGVIRTWRLFAAVTSRCHS